MKKIITILILFLAVISCVDKDTMDDNILNGTYAKKFNIIHYKTIPMYDADTKSFEILSFYYAKDKDHIYFGNNIINDADISTFQILGDNISKDKNHVYYQEKILEKADPETFVGVNSGRARYFSDKKAIYSKEGKVLDIDVNKVRILERNFVMDDKNVYYDGKKIRGIDIKSFEALTQNYSKDKNHVYIEQRILENADSETFEVIVDKSRKKSERFSKDKNNVYYYDEIIRGADPETFEQIGNIYAKDKNNIYESNKVLDINVENYTIWENGNYIKDDGKVYWGSILIENADSLTFQELGLENLAKDKNHVYSGDGIIDNLEPNYLQYIGGPYYLYKTEVLYLGTASLLGKKRKSETSIDGKNYVYLGDEFIKDKKNVYYAGQVLNGVNPEDVNNIEDVEKLRRKVMDGLLGIKKRK